MNNEESEDKEKPLQARFLTDPSKAPLPRQPETEEEETKPLQAKSAGARSDTFEAGADVETQVSLSKGRGSPLPDPVRAYMEPRFGVDFSQVRVHTDSDAIQMNRDVGAQAFTHGSDIYFGESRSPTNLELTAHELTHVIQQTGSPPLQTKKLEEKVAPLGPEPSIQRICAACGVGKEEERKFDPNSSHELTHLVQEGGTALADRQGEARSGKQDPPMQISRTTRTDASGLLQRAVTNLAVAGAAAEAGHANDFVVARGAGPVIVTATVSAPGQAVTWTGGGPRPGNNLERVVTATSARTVAVTADTPADPGSQNVTVHVVNGRTAPANTPAPLSFSRQPGIPPGFPHAPNEFGLTDVRVNNPAARVRAFLAGNQWAFQVDRISHRYQMAVASANINIPTAASATNANHCQVIADMTPGGAAVPPPNAVFWSRPIVEAHEFAHVARFYSPAFWEAFMRIAEANIEAAASNVNVDHTVPATLSDSGVVTANAPAHQAILDAQHAAADAAEIPGAEAFAHGQSNPMFTTLVAQIAARFRPLAPTVLGAVALGPASVQLNWTHNACNETEYRVYRRRGTSAFGKIATLPAGTVAFNDTLAGLAGNTDFTYFVTAAGVAGESARSNQAPIHTP